MNNQPDYLVCNPYHTGFIQVPMIYVNKPYLNFFNEIDFKKELEPVKLHRKIENIADPNCYNKASRYSFLRILFPIK